MKSNVAIVIPIYNDWESAKVLINRIHNALIGISFQIILINDGSYNEDFEFKNEKLHLVNLVKNMGHQKAIAIGIAYAVKNLNFDHLIIMDGDGEDNPKDILTLLEKCKTEQGALIFAERRSRKETLLFRLSYYIYKQLFRFLTGVKISFGNFCIMSFNDAKKLSYVTEIWNNFPAGVINSKIKYSKLLIDRDKRIAGESKMNFLSLIQHGLGAISVFFERVTVRVIIATSFLFILLIALCCIAIYRKFISHEATPGWLTTIVFSSLILIVQLILLSVFMLFSSLNSKMQKQFIPLIDFEVYIRNIEKFDL
jgi:hypothetical protein